MATKYTIQDALAYIAITGRKRGLTLKTRIAVMGWEQLDSETLTYRVTEAGMELARKSRIWKAHEDILARGYKLDRKDRVSFISYIKLEDDLQDKSGFISKGRVYIAKDGSRFATELVAQFKNG